MKKILLASLLMIAFSGCGGSGSINWNNARQVKKDMTEAQVIALMGKPYSIRADADGAQLWIWVHTNALTRSGGSVSIPMRDGKTIGNLVVPDSFK